MALKRETLKAMGLNEEQITSIIEMHLETVNGLKADLATYEADAKKLPDVQKELDDLKAKGDDGWKDKHDTLKGEYETYKTKVESEKSKTAKEAAVRAYYESNNITGKALDIAMRGSRAEIDAIELDGDKIKDASALDALVTGDFAGLVSTTITQGANTPTPPVGKGGSAQDLGSLPMADYIAARKKK